MEILRKFAGSKQVQPSYNRKVSDFQNKLRQEQQQRLQQRLNPQSVALGRMLEMSVPELEDEVRRELDENPALEAVNSPAETEQSEFTETSDQLQLADYADSDDAPAYLRHAANGDDSAHIESSSFAADEGESMGEVLMRRLAGESELSEGQLRIAAHIIGNLDDNGYLRRSLNDIADDIAIIEGVYADPDDMAYVFDQVRMLDPAGICATDLRDCLLLQLDRRQNSVTLRIAKEVVGNYFDLFSKKHFDRIQSQLGINREEMEKALELIRSLNPKPASALETGRGVGRAAAVTPDFYLDYDATDDTFSLSLPGNIPELGIESTFAADDTADNTTDHTAAAFIRRKRNEATSFIRLLGQRNSTLMAIGQAIVKLQRDFMLSGDKADIRPMILKDVAAVTGLDLSVISRATSGKYILTPHGLYPLKLFFNERPDAETDVSTHEILDTLTKLINKEDKRHPLSDQALCDALATAGYDIARRTVAKYRERLGIPVARLRRSF